MQYWHFIRLDSGGGNTREAIAPAKAFFQAYFPTAPSDREIQKRLFQLLSAEEEETRRLAECCLRCYISTQISRSCRRLAAKYGENHSFRYEDLLPYVLTDTQPEVSCLQTTGYQGIAYKILRTYHPDSGSSLATWIDRITKNDNDLNHFLLEQGVLLMSDWSILNDTTPQKLRRILSGGSLPWSEGKIQQASYLLEGYHNVYLRDRRAQYRVRDRGPCNTPTPQQLQEIAQSLQQTDTLQLSPPVVLDHLRKLARELRRHRIQTITKTLAELSLDEQREDGHSIFDDLAAPEPNDAEAEQNEFLTQYRQEFVRCLDQAIVEVVQRRLSSLHPPKDQQWLLALSLRYCRGISMGAIAPRVKLPAQYAVSRLLQLKALYADIRHCVLGLLVHSIQQLAQEYTDPNRLQDLDQKINSALQALIDTVMTAAADEMNIPNHQPKSLFSQRLCRYLEEVKDISDFPL